MDSYLYANLEDRNQRALLKESMTQRAELAQGISELSAYLGPHDQQGSPRASDIIHVFV